MGLVTNRSDLQINATTYLFAGAMILKNVDVKESCIKQFSVLAGVEVCCLLGSLIGPIETVFWAAIFLLAKTVHLFIPRSVTVATSICGFMYSQFQCSLMFTLLSVTGVVSNFFTSSSDELFDSSACILHPSLEGLEASKGFFNYQFFD